MNIKMDYLLFDLLLDYIKQQDKRYNLTSKKNGYYLIAKFGLYRDNTLKLINKTIKSNNQKSKLITALTLCNKYLTPPTTTIPITKEKEDKNE